MDDLSLVDAWLQSLKRRNYSPGSLGNYRGTLHHLRRWNAERARSLEDITHTDVRDWLDLHDHAASTRYAAISTISSFYRWAIREEHLDRDPTARVERPRLPRRLPRPAADADVARALEKASPRTLAMIALGCFAGLRRKEIAALRGEDLLRPASVLVIYVRGKGDRDRYVPVHDELLAALAAYGLPDRGWVFPSPITSRGLSPGHVGRLMTDVLGAARPHQLRHWFATKTLDECDNLRVVQELLGHASPATTAVYTKLSPRKAAKAVAAIAVPTTDDQEAA